MKKRLLTCVLLLLGSGITTTLRSQSWLQSGPEWIDLLGRNYRSGWVPKIAGYELGTTISKPSWWAKARFACSIKDMILLAYAMDTCFTNNRIPIMSCGLSIGSPESRLRGARDGQQETAAS